MVSLKATFGFPEISGQLYSVRILCKEINPSINQSTEETTKYYFDKVEYQAVIIKQKGTRTVKDNERANSRSYARGLKVTTLPLKASKNLLNGQNFLTEKKLSFSPTVNTTTDLLFQRCVTVALEKTRIICCNAEVQMLNTFEHRPNSDPSQTSHYNIKG